MIQSNVQIATDSIIRKMCIHGSIFCEKHILSKCYWIYDIYQFANCYWIYNIQHVYTHMCVYIYMYIYVYIYSCTYVTQGVVPSSYIDLALQPDAFCHTPVWVICAFRIFEYEVFKCTLIITCTLPFQKFCTTTLMHLHKNLRHTATHCNTLQHTATHCNTLQHTMCLHRFCCITLCVTVCGTPRFFWVFFLLWVLRTATQLQHTIWIHRLYCNTTYYLLPSASAFPVCCSVLQLQHTICRPPQALSPVDVFSYDVHEAYVHTQWQSQSILVFCCGILQHTATLFYVLQHSADGMMLHHYST